MSHCNELLCQQVTLSGSAEWPKVADAVIEAQKYRLNFLSAAGILALCALTNAVNVLCC
jgi:hypothetical protein